MLGLGLGLNKIRKRGGAAPFDFSSIPGLRVCLLPGQGITEVDGGVDVWQSQFVDSYAEAPQASMRPTPQINSESGKLVPWFDGLDDRLLFKESSGSNLTAGVTTSIRIIKSDGFKTVGAERMFIFTDFSDNGWSYSGHEGDTRTVINNNYGAPSLRVDGQNENPANRGEVWDLIYAVNANKLMTVLSGDISTWTAPQIGGYRNETSGTFMYQGQVVAELLYDGELTQPQYETVEAELLKLVQQ